MSNRKNVLSAYSSLNFIYICTLELLISISRRCQVGTIFSHFALLFIDCIYYSHKQWYSLNRYFLFCICYLFNDDKHLTNFCDQFYFAAFAHLRRWLDFVKFLYRDTMHWTPPECRFCIEIIYKCKHLGRLSSGEKKIELLTH